MRELIDKEKTYEILTEYYHHRTEIQHMALRDALNRVPTENSESLTDEEKRIFLSAMLREEKFCKEVVGLFLAQRTDLVRICHEITRKVKEALWS